MALTQKEREVYSAPEGQDAPIHLPQHHIIIPNHRRRRAFVGFLHQEQREREREKRKQIKKEKDLVFPVNMVALLRSFNSSSLSQGGS